jgi:hypothetical protein
LAYVIHAPDTKCATAGSDRIESLQRPTRSATGRHHSITSSARASTVAGTSIANDLAVLRLTRRRNFVASITGNSVRYGGLPPLCACAEHTHMRDDPDRCPHDHGSADDVRIAFDSQSPRRGGDALPLINLEKRDVRLPRRRLCLLDEGPDPGRTFHHPR